MTARAPLRSVADVRALEAIPLDVRAPFRSTYEMLADAARRVPGGRALIWLPDGVSHGPRRSWTFAELLGEITRCANGLHAAGVRPGAPVSLLLPNLPETHFLLWGGSAAGEVNPVNPLLSPEQIAQIVIAAGSGTLATTSPDLDAALWDKAQAVRKLLPSSVQVVTMGGAPPPGAASLDAIIAGHSAGRLTTGREISPDDVSTYFHTGGTTGAPKLAQQTHGNQVAMAWTMAHAIDCGPGDMFLTGLPLFHANAAILSGLTAFASGAGTVLAGLSGFRAKPVLADFWNAVDAFKVTHFSAVPTILASLLDVLRGDADVSSLRVCVCGAAPLAVSLFRAFEEATGLRLLEAYGMTEGTLASTINPRDGERRIGSIGIGLPYQQIRVAILDDEHRLVREAAPDEVGTILLSGPTVTPGYKQAEHNAGAWPEPGWLNTGDLARRDADGYFWLAGRAKDLIIRSGHNIDPAVIEEALHRHPAVELAAAVGRPDDYAGEIPVAFVSLRAGARATAQELVDYAREHVAERPAAPAAVYILPELPRTAVGKIFKPTLREIAARDVVEAALADLGGDVRVSAQTERSRGLVVTVACGQAVLAGEIERRLQRLPIAIDVIEQETA